MLESVIIVILGIATGFIFVKVFILLCDICGYLREIRDVLISFEKVFFVYSNGRLGET